MEIQTIRLTTVSDALTSLLYDAKNDINDNFGGGSLFCPFISSYESYMVDYVPWKDDIEGVSLDVSSFDTELRDNFLQMDETKRLNYLRFLKNRLEPIFATAKEMRLQLSDLRDKIKNGEINEREVIDDSGHKNRTIGNFTSYLNNALVTVQDVESVYVRNIGVFHYSAIKPLNSVDEQLQKKDKGVVLQWNGDKTDLAELVWALVKSNQIIDADTNKPVIISELTRQFEILFSVEKLDVDGLVSKRIRNTYKSADGKTFMDTLQKLMRERITSALKK